MTSTLNLEYKEVKRSLILHPIESLSELTSRLRRIDEINIIEIDDSPTLPESVAISIPNRFKNHLATRHHPKINIPKSPSYIPNSSAPVSHPNCERCGGQNHLAKDCTTKWHAINRKRTENQSKKRSAPSFQKSSRKYNVFLRITGTNMQKWP
jgi:hypothetical protein